MFRRFVLLSATALLWACQDHQTPVDPAAEDLQMNLSAGNDFRGRYVVRFAEDLERGLLIEETDLLELEDGSTLELKFRGRRPDIHPGDRVRVRGERKAASIDVAEGGTTTVESGTATPVSASLAPATKRVAVVLFNFSNNTSQPYSTAYAAGIAFNNTNSVAAYYRSNSWDSVNLVGDVYGWFTIPESNTTCNYSAWGSSATKVAAAAGIDLSSSRYEHVVFAFPATSACSWSGIANMPGRFSYLNERGMSLRIMAHELGHNFGTHHASTYSCSEGGVRVSLSATAANCTRSEYGDPFSVMGASTRRHTNPSLANFAWMPSANRLDVSRSGDYRLAPLFSADGTQSIRIQRSSTSFLTLEYRAAGPFDTFSSSDPVVNGVTLRLNGGDKNRTQSLLIDATPSTSGFGDAPLAVGRTFVDPLTGVSITTLAVSSAGADVRISWSGDSSPPPEPDTSPPTQPGSLAASPVDANRISLSWNASTDNVGVAGYRVLRGGTPVATVSTTWYSDPGLAPATSYSYQVIAFDGAGNASTPASASATTLSADVTPPTAPSNLRASVNKKKVSLSWDASTDDVAVAGYRVFRDGRLVATLTGTGYTGNLPGGRNPSATYWVVAFDAAGNESGESNRVVVGG